MKTFKGLQESGITFAPAAVPITVHDIQEFESHINAKLPDCYRDYLLHSNGKRFNLNISSNDKFRYNAPVEWSVGHPLYRENYKVRLDYMLGIDHSLTEENSMIVTTLQWRYDLMSGAWPKDTIAIAVDPGDDLILLGVGKENYDQVFFLTYEKLDARLYDVNDGALLVAYHGKVADSFYDFIKLLELAPPISSYHR